VVSASAGHSRPPEGGTANPYEEQPKGCTPTVMSPFFALKSHRCQTCQSRISGNNIRLQQSGIRTADPAIFDEFYIVVRNSQFIIRNSLRCMEVPSK
jgi:hypothetical protein